MSKCQIWVSHFIAEQYKLTNIIKSSDNLLLVEVNNVDLIKLDNDSIHYSIHPIGLNIGDIE